MSVPAGPDEALPLAADFPERTHEEWQALAAAVVNRGRAQDRQVDGAQAEESLTTTTVDGLRVKPLYARYAGEPIDAIGLPGAMPFTRGSGAREPGTGWDVRALHEDPDAEVTTAAAALDLERGVTSLWFEVGEHAVGAGDLAAILADVDLADVPIAVSSASDPTAAADALAAVWRDRGVADRAAGTLGHDPLAHAARHDAEPEDGPMIEAVRSCAADLPGVRAIAVDTRPYHDAGAGDVDELGLAIATGIAHLRTLADAGIAAPEAFAQIEFRVAVGADQFLSIARLRALRRLWARVGEVAGVPEGARGAWQHAVTSRRMISRDDPWVNLLRGTAACFAAAAGGAEAVTVLPFDAAIGLPDALSRRTARNTQLLLAQESNVGRVADPAGGSWYVEELTDDLARAGWAWMQRIEAAGGVAAALRSGLVGDRIAATAAERDARIATRELPLTGVSSFPDAAEAPLTRRPRPASPPSSRRLPPRRDAEPFEALRDAARAGAERDGGPPAVPLLCLGARRDFGARETFTTSVLAAGGLAAPQLMGTPEEQAARLRELGSPVAVLCSSASRYAEDGAGLARAARDAGVRTLYVAGRAAELGDAADAVDGEVRAGADVLALLRAIQSELGLDAPAGLDRAASTAQEGDRS
ncbi:methylmalonyl-CoA mutase family protein [Agilicoccus flavus]|uniref:methylmalonyl-CoA mutase family protein n=1 Tax=Agilicoccus flavus TaxID=2775968 RepID=UPI001CF67049|nr:methylmalonyl-CoA mutase family protein [Agilicoccus flavus]